MTNDSCYKCPDRKAHCHSTCDKHIKRIEKHHEKQAEIRAARDKEQEINSVSIAGKIKALKRRDGWREKER